ncbi:hypothetical protein scyTo_0022428 [Scyliorhinus torazame]|uniref:Ig-like domain-containing protein n=1 Tax=Scyliorhinus torazame TaxID=75743 RepID=A0A401Q6F9_SCYTO|nr:hypothetical protein [Scyliorhinus torazame]
MTFIQKCSLQINTVFLLTISGLLLTESSDDVENVYSELGKPIFLHVWDQSSNKYHEVKWMYNGNVAGRYKDGSFRVYGGYKDRLNIFPNGTLTLKISKTTDNGKYICEIYDKAGIRQSTKNFQLHLLGKFLSLLESSPKLWTKFTG